jgi:hypothetical protein
MFKRSDHESFGKYHHREKGEYSKYGNLEDIISSILLKQINKIISPKIRIGLQ